VTNLRNLEEIFESLQSLGYEAVLNDGFIAVKIGTNENPFTAVLNIINNNLAINCQVAQLGQIKNQTTNRGEYFFTLLAADLAPLAPASGQVKRLLAHVRYVTPETNPPRVFSNVEFTVDLKGA